MSHLEKIAFCGLRRLNQFKSYSNDIFGEWLNNRKWHELTGVNVFIGANGSGKSTVLELVDFLRAPEHIVTLPRENQARDCLSAFHLCFTNGCQLIGTIVPNKISNKPFAANINETTDGLDIQYLSLIGIRLGDPLFFLEKNISKKQLDSVSHREISNYFSSFDAQILYFSPDWAISKHQLVMELNAARENLGGILSEAEWTTNDPDANDDFLLSKKSNPFQEYDENRIAMYLSDDSFQQNHVHLRSLPAGWQQIASILSWLKEECPFGAICLLEEPETHLHPRLQRYLAKKMGEIAWERGLQLLISTHSPVFQQLKAWPHGANIFAAQPSQLSKLNSAWSVLDALGIKGSDISQSNGVIWVEGPSDRLYIKHWIKLYCHENHVPEPLENIDYSFLFYGGAALTHFSIDDTESFIDLLGINRNLIMIIDQDNDFSLDDSEKLICFNTLSSKARILNAIQSYNSNKCYAWVTDQYTIESYLPVTFRSLYFDEEGTRLVLKKHQKKVAVATRYIKQFTTIKECSNCKDKLFTHIENLYKTIKSWDH